MIVSCEASSTFQRKSFQDDCFVRCLRQFSQTELPKRAFRVMLPTIFTEKTSKMIISCEASFKFHRTMLPKRAFRTMLPTIFTEKASKMIVSCEASSKFHRTMLPKRAASDNFHQKFAFRYSFAQSKRRFLREGSSAKSKMCLALQRREFPNFKMYVSLQRRAQKCMNLSTVNRPASRTQKCNVLLQFWAIDATFLARGFTASK